MKCPKCGLDNPTIARFCMGCGNPLVPFPVEERFKIAKKIIPKTLVEKISSLEIEGERKNVTVLFADISGFSALSEKLDPEELTELINNCFKELIKVIYKYEGNIDKFIGDCIMALFGAPVAHEDDPERAVHSAMEIMAASDQFNERNKTNLSLHIGIHSGIVIAGGVGSDLRMDYTVMGDTVNLAERLMEQAKDEILVSESVYKKTKFLFEMHELEPVKVRGKKKIVKPYRVIGIKERPERKRGIQELHSSLVGRDKEFKIIKSALNEIFEGNGVVVSIIGEAGLGKSRLIEELRQYIGKKVNWLRGRPFSYGKAFPFRIILEQIRYYIGISELEFGVTASKKLEDELEILFKDRINEYFPYLCVFLSIRVPEHLQEKVKYLSPDTLRLQEFISIKALLREIARNKPLILYFEDTHWIDSESIELIKFLLDGLEDEPIFFLFETRPEGDTGLYSIKEFIKKIFKKKYIEVYLKLLKTNDTVRLIQNLLSIPIVPEDVSSLILKKSEGNPFYIEEIIRSFIDTGVLKRKKGEFYLEEDITSFKIPDTVEAVIRSRLDSLPSKAKEVIGNASVIGESFLYRILFNITNHKEIEDELKILRRAEFILKKASPSTSQLPLDMEYQFKHILIKDVAYKGLLKRKRREIHRKVAECMENIFKERIEDYYEMLGHHYCYAEFFEKSYDYYKKAGDKAKELYENVIAIECYTKAIEIHKRLFSYGEEELAELFEKKGDVRALKGEYKDALVDYDIAFSSYKDIEKKADIKKKIGNIFLVKSEYDTAISSFEEAIRMLKVIPKSPLLSEILISYSFLLLNGKSDYPGAKEMIEQAIANIDEKKSKLYAKSLNILGGIFRHKGNYKEALKHRLKALAIYEELDDKKGLAGASNNIGLTYLDVGELDTALKYLNRNLAISEEIGYKRGICNASLNIGIVYCEKGEFDTALKYYKRNLVISEERGDERGVGMASNNIGIIYQNKGKLSTALKYFKKYLTISEKGNDKAGIAEASNNIGNVYYNKGDFSTALRYYETDLTISEEIDHKRRIGIAYYSMGEVYTEMKNFDKAEEYLKRSENILKEVGDKGSLSEAYTKLAMLNICKKSYESALIFAREAHSLAKEIGAIKQEILALREMGRALSKENHKKAISYLEQSIALARDKKMTLELGKALYELVAVLKDKEKNKKTEEYIKEARKIFMKSGATTWIKKYKG
ncbi:tetratricopeptide repeat protein [candidate division WOR-3 bacterium]|nr:tetratricopeptide repeat protein [candidate division WOR-3 bacterium]